METKKEETTMERKIGQIFQHNKKWYQCVEDGDGCQNCTFYNKEYGCCDTLSPDYYCCDRSDRKDVIFKELEKVGEPYTSVSPSGRTICFQRYRTYIKPLINTEVVGWTTGNLNFIDIEIKQNEDMKKTNSELSNIEKIGENLKPFSIEAAKAGKPVCTRDGRKARIICFDAKGDKPIIALIEMGVAETPNNYPIDGKAIPTKETPCDLMMLPEKKEGWVNVYKREDEYICENECSVSTGIAVYKSESEAKRNIDKNEIYVNTIKITWEE